MSNYALKKIKKLKHFTCIFFVLNHVYFLLKIIMFKLDKIIIHDKTFYSST